MYATVKVDEASLVDDKTQAKLPEPTGYRILIALPEIDEKTEGGVIMPDSLKSVEETASIVGFVLKVGPTAYKDESRFPDGAWCKAGDFVIFRSYSGTRFKIHGKEFRLINDDTVDAVVDDPRGYTRA
jgi:chaperonin GroES|tara:strand:+ start:4699 stop:5082 length:384 start_codon:yes stop_codon:yes gene_type:complete